MSQEDRLGIRTNLREQPKFGTLAKTRLLDSGSIYRIAAAIDGIVLCCARLIKQFASINLVTNDALNMRIYELRAFLLCAIPQSPATSL